MKKIVILFAVVSLLFAYTDDASGQSRKEYRKARKEQRRQEKALKDSLMMQMKGSDSVNVGYGYVKEKGLSSSVSRLEVTKKRAASYNDISDYIQGRVPGVMVQKNGESVRYIIRGIGTNSDATDPLLMVDGVEVDNFNGVIPENVESVEVIKDASASIYGMRGANGVIMITTKK